jgi:hypothetical protein
MNKRQDRHYSTDADEEHSGPFPAGRRSEALTLIRVFDLGDASSTPSSSASGSVRCVQA